MRSLSRPEGCLSDFAFDELHAAELEPSVRREVEAHLSDCARCRDRREALSREREALLASVPELAALTQPRPPRASRSVSRPRAIALAGTALALAAAALLMLRPKTDEQVTDTRSKGAARLGLFVKRGERVFRAETGATVRPGDLVRFTYSSERARHLAVLNLDPHTAQVYFPTDASADARALRVRAGSDVALDFSVELDATAGDEHVFGLFCDEPIALAPLRTELEEKRALPDLAGCAVERLVLHKELTP